jgi:hypothetical protein
MAGLQVAGRNAMVSGLAAVVTYIGLFDATGTELIGGSPSYARKPVVWNAPAAGRADNTADMFFDVPPVTTVAFHGGFSALNGGTNYFVLPVQGAVQAAPQACTFDTTGDLFTSFGHGYGNGTRIYLSDVAGGGLATGFDENTLYYVVNTTTDTFKLSATLGGAAITTTTSFEAFATKCVPEDFAAQGQYKIPAGGLALESNLI